MELPVEKSWKKYLQRNRSSSTFILKETGRTNGAQSYWEGETHATCHLRLYSCGSPSIAQSWNMKI